MSVPTGIFTIADNLGHVIFTPNERLDPTHPATVVYMVTDSLGHTASANIVVNDPPFNPVADAIDDLAHTGLNALGPLPVGIFAAIVGVGILYYSRQQMRAVAVSANSINKLREVLYSSYAAPVKDYAAIERDLDRERLKRYSDYRPD